MARERICFAMPSMAATSGISWSFHPSRQGLGAGSGLRSRSSRGARRSFFSLFPGSTTLSTLSRPFWAIGTIGTRPPFGSWRASVASRSSFSSAVTTPTFIAMRAISFVELCCETGRGIGGLGCPRGTEHVGKIDSVGGKICRCFEVVAHGKSHASMRGMAVGKHETTPAGDDFVWRLAANHLFGSSPAEK